MHQLESESFTYLCYSSSKLVLTFVLICFCLCQRYSEAAEHVLSALRLQQNDYTEDSSNGMSGKGKGFGSDILWDTCVSCPSLGFLSLLSPCFVI